MLFISLGSLQFQCPAIRQQWGDSCDLAYGPACPDAGTAVITLKRLHVANSDECTLSCIPPANNRRRSVSSLHNQPAKLKKKCK